MMQSENGESNELISFRMKFVPVFVYMFVCLVIYGALFYAAGSAKRDSIALVLFAACLASVPVVWLIIFIFPTQAGGGGIRSYTSYGLFRTLAWEDIVSVKLTGIPGLRAIKVISGKGQEIWVPLFLGRWEEFRKTVIASAQNPDNPLVVYLMNEKEDTPEDTSEGSGESKEG